MKVERDGMRGMHEEDEEMGAGSHLKINRQCLESRWDGGATGILPADEPKTVKKRVRKQTEGEYASITTAMREQLIDFIFIRKCMEVKQASKLLNMKYQTAKSILRRYKQTGKADRCNKILKKGAFNNQKGLALRQEQTHASIVAAQASHIGINGLSPKRAPWP